MNTAHGTSNPPSFTARCVRSDGHRRVAVTQRPSRNRILAEERLSGLKATLDDMRRDRDAWRDQVQRFALPNTPERVSLRRWLRLDRLMGDVLGFDYRMGELASGSLFPRQP
jgi:hypothetical protein